MPDWTISFTVLTCCHQGCGISFAVPEWWETKRREDHSNWYCPHGHPQHFCAESDVEKARREKKEIELRLQAEANEAHHAQLVAERERDKAIRAKRKIERRVKAGVCPCCNRTFGDLASHMSTKHKDYALPPAKPKLIEAAS